PGVEPVVAVVETGDHHVRPALDFSGVARAGQVAILDGAVRHALGGAAGFRLDDVGARLEQRHGRFAAGGHVSTVAQVHNAGFDVGVEGLGPHAPGAVDADHHRHAFQVRHQPNLV